MLQIVDKDEEIGDYISEKISQLVLQYSNTGDTEQHTANTQAASISKIKCDDEIDENEDGNILEVTDSNECDMDSWDDDNKEEPHRADYVDVEDSDEEDAAPTQMYIFSLM